MKKVLVACGMVFLSLFAVGCDKVIELTEEESRMVAEYAAELLLKYDRNIDLKYYDDSEPFVITTEQITEDTTEEVDDITTQDPEPEEPTTGNVTSEDVTTEVPGTEEVVDGNYTNVIDAEDFDLADFVNVPDVNIIYSHYMIVDSYPSYDMDGVYVEIEAPVGYKLLVLKFKLENGLNETQYIDMYNKDVTYNIIINDERTAKQMLTLLLDDLYTYQKNLEASVLEETVVMYQISDSVAESIDDLKLRITYSDKEQIISLE